MKKIQRIFQYKSVDAQIREFEQIVSYLSASGGEEALSEEDTQVIARHLASISDPRLWHLAWAVLLYAPRNEHILEYARYVLMQESHGGGSAKPLDNALRYLFKHAPAERTQLLATFLSSRDVRLRFAAAEEMARTNLGDALCAMLDIYEEARRTHHHDVTNGIEIWIWEEGNQAILPELRLRRDCTRDNKLRQQFDSWIQAIESKAAR